LAICHVRACGSTSTANAGAATKGELRIVAFNSGTDIKYSVDAGRTLKASQFIDADDMRKLRGVFAAAQAKLATLPK
jgi:hypothetical protein